MKRIAAAAVLAIVLLPISSYAANVNATVKRALATELGSVNLANSSFADALDYLRDVTGANINVNWKILNNANITKETPVNVKLRSIPMRKALQLILDEAGAATPLTYFIDEGVIEITTREAADAKLITRVYDVSDLIVEIPDFAGPDLNLMTQSNSNSGSGSGSGNSSNIFGGGNSNGNTNKEPAKTATERGNELVSIVTGTIRPEIWEVNGGTATIRYFRGRLIVTAPRSVQEMIGGRGD